MTDCDIIRDLLPLYHDSACSPASRALVEEHLPACEVCRGELEALEAPVALAPPPAFQAQIQRLKEAKSKLVRKAVLAVTAVFCALAVFIAGGTLLYTQFEKERALPWEPSMLAGASGPAGEVHLKLSLKRYVRASCLFRRVTVEGQPRDVAILQLTQSWTRQLFDTVVGGPEEAAMGVGTGLYLSRGAQKHDVAYGPEYEPAYWNPSWEYPGSLRAVYYLESPSPLELKDAPEQTVLDALEQRGRLLWEPSL